MIPGLPACLTLYSVRVHALLWTIVELPFPDHVPGVPPGVECFEALDSLSSLPAFVDAVSVLQPRLEACLAAMRPRVCLLVADVFLYWAHSSAAALRLKPNGHSTFH
ncbi:hypothetical protein E2562_035935 [Oryza meyeriana var. granulata]|uniref:Secreted protein n=1 Tax=Oryza meyeriana var. granulata TaxID=110450 RepID=A0A6G1DRB0_9ORYZ|nr:hypothetical protein E2562_035935 [Oryza meyeriana var. granulata]